MGALTLSNALTRSTTWRRRNLPVFSHRPIPIHSWFSHVHRLSISILHPEYNLPDIQFFLESVLKTTGPPPRTSTTPNNILQQ